MRTLVGRYSAARSFRARLAATGAGQDGFVTVFTVIIVVALFVLAGLVFDGGRAMDGRVTALDEAQEAARAGAQQIDLPTFRATGTAILNDNAAVTAAENYIAATGDSGTATVTGDIVTVTVTHIEPTEILSMIGIGSFTENATATATAEQGP
jgi:Flp pilus assembly protein TadG